MKRLLPLALALVAAACADSSSPLAPIASGPTGQIAASKGGAGKVDVCHVTGNGGYVLINVSVNALPAHMAHGDGLPGQGGLAADCSQSTSTPLTFTSFGFDYGVYGFAAPFLFPNGVPTSWTVQGGASPVTYYVEYEGPTPGTWTLATAVAPFTNPTVGSGSGPFTMNIVACEATVYRVRAVDANNNTVVSDVIPMACLS